MTKSYVRADALIGVSRFGRRRDGPGCYYETICQTDCKINSWTMKVVAPLMPKGMIDWGVALRSFMTKKEAELKDK